MRVTGNADTKRHYSQDAALMASHEQLPKTLAAWVCEICVRYCHELAVRVEAELKHIMSPPTSRAQLFTEGSRRLIALSLKCEILAQGNLPF